MLRESCCCVLALYARRAAFIEESGLSCSVVKEESSLEHATAQLEYDDMKAAGLCWRALRKPRPLVLVERVANSHSDSVK